MNKLRTLAPALLSAALLAACATHQRPLYYWGNYQDYIYGHFKGTKGPEEQIQAMERMREQARAKGMQMPPGFHAHLAMLYGQTGRGELLAENLEIEKRLFPESATYVDFLLKKPTSKE